MIFRDERERKKQMKVEREWGRERERANKKEITRFGGDGGAVIAEKVERR